MGVIKLDDVIAWADGNKIICVECGDPGEAKPPTKEYFEDTDIVTCDECGQRIQ